MPETYRLDPEDVRVVFGACIAQPGDEDVIEAENCLTGPVGLGDGGHGTLRFSKREIGKFAEQIAQMLLELPTEFRASGGGGWSFLNACLDRHGNQWTGLHQTMAQLFALGQAIGMVELQLPPDLWDVLPGGMPYYVIKDGPIPVKVVQT